MDDRKGYIGGSDIAAVMGVSRFKTPLMLWAEKVGQVEPKDLSDNEAVELGSELEDFVAKKFERKTGMKVRRAPQNYQHKVHPWMRCQVDRLITGTDELLEVKTCSAWNEKEWQGEEIPTEYVLQVSWQLFITGRKVGHIAVLIGGQKFRYKKIETDLELFDTMFKAAVAFWKMVQDKTPPIAVAGDDEVLLALFPKSNDQIQAVEEMNDRIALLQKTKADIKALEAVQDEHEVKLKEIIKDNLGIKTSEYIVKWTPTTTSRIDIDKMKEAGIYEAYLKKTESRRLTITKNKERS